jgi:hypothetical protein
VLAAGDGWIAAHVAQGGAPRPVRINDLLW